MKIMTDNEELLTLSEHQKAVIANDIPVDLLIEDLKRRLSYIVTHKYERCMERLKQEWVPKLKEKGLESIPLNDKELADLIFSQEEYQDRQARMNDEERARLPEVIDQYQKIIDSYRQKSLQ